MRKVFILARLFVVFFVLSMAQAGCGYNLVGNWTGFFGKDDPKAGTISLDITSQNSGGVVEGSIEMTNVKSCNGGQNLSRTLLESGSLVTDSGKVTLITKIGGCKFTFSGEFKNGLILGSYTNEYTIVVTFKDSGSFNLERP
ncbi:MAG: hypothetical protein H6728_10025 [Myxococcales bacterium]|nr:hypothetical protein [Myxococcales bacterium]MCB9643399.1 hypothetical protein [Myxococcales bacterium]